jgi:hypothetical protein
MKTKSMKNRNHEKTPPEGGLQNMAQAIMKHFKINKEERSVPVPDPLYNLQMQQQ